MSEPERHGVAWTEERGTSDEGRRRLKVPRRRAGNAASALLEVRDLSVHHGQLQALREVSLAVPAGTVHAMIGANGAGKSTLLRTIAGLHRPTSGSILLDGTDITALRPEQRVAAGVVMVPEGRRLFPSLTVQENLEVGRTSARHGPWTIQAVYELFDWMRDRRDQRAAQLSGGEQQAVALGRALVANPRVLLLDELSLGLAPVVVRRIYALLPQLLESGVTVLLVEQDVSQALAVATRLHCLLEGRIVLAGQPADLTAAQIEIAYFGETARGRNGRNGGGGGDGERGNDPRLSAAIKPAPGPRQPESPGGGA